MAVAVSVIFVGVGYATGAVDGGDGSDDAVGGLVGQTFGTITASYASGDADGGDDQVGGLVGSNGPTSTITASYATGDVDGGDVDVDGDRVGGLVGWIDGTITASYATGDVDGGDGDNDRVGGLVGWIDGTITASYGFGTKTGEEVTTGTVDRSGDASPAGTVANAAALTQANSSTSTPAGMNDWSTTVWNFSSGTRRPFLRWVTAFNFSCVSALLPTLPSQQVCGGIIPGQDRTP